MERGQEDMHGGATQIAASAAGEHERMRRSALSRHLRILLRAIIGGSVSERPNKNRHTVGIDYFHCNPRLNY
jgi:hypothetical protein